MKNDKMAGTKVPAIFYAMIELAVKKSAICVVGSACLHTFLYLDGLMWKCCLKQAEK